MGEPEGLITIREVTMSISIGCQRDAKDARIE